MELICKSPATRRDAASSNGAAGANLWKRPGGHHGRIAEAGYLTEAGSRWIAQAQREYGQLRWQPGTDRHF